MTKLHAIYLGIVGVLVGDCIWYGIDLLRQMRGKPSIVTVLVRWISGFLPALERREIIICERCHTSGFVKWPCSRCSHIVGTPIQTASGEWSMQ